MDVYDTIIGPLFTPWARNLLERLSPPSGCSALDVAAGPGTVTHILAERIGLGGRVIASDISPAMLQIAARKPVTAGSAPIEWIQASATPLPLPDASVDILTCQQGLQFFPDKIAALAEMRRVLRPGGRCGVAVWTQVEDQIFSYLRDAVKQVVSNDAAARYLGPFQLAGAQAKTCATAAGFRNIDLETVTLPAVLAGGASELVATLPASGIADDIAALDEAAHAELLAEVTRLTRPLRVDNAIHSSLTASVLTLS
ncbi:MAG: class I SAM-dependent methyltransferase [Jatrophihabitantaceae bacterium]